jgi:hypothetical protein
MKDFRSSLPIAVVGTTISCIDWFRSRPVSY